MRSNILKLKPHQAKAQNRAVLVRFLLHSARAAKGWLRENTVSGNRKELQMRRALRFRISGITEGIPTLQVAEVLDLSLGGAVVKHQRMFEPQRPCFLQLATTGNVSTIRCRIAHSRASGTGPDGEQYHQTMLEFRNPTAAAKKLLKTLIQSFGSHGGWEIAGP